VPDDSSSAHEEDPTPDGYGEDRDGRSLRQEESRVRSKLANERTFASWIRTATAVTVVGLAISRFLAEEQGGREIWFLALGGGYVLAGVGLFWFAAYNYFLSRKQMKRARFEGPRRFLIAIALILSLLSIGLIIVVGYEALTK
jgi:putative membrane protein